MPNSHTVLLLSTLQYGGEKGKKGQILRTYVIFKSGPLNTYYAAAIFCFRGISMLLMSSIFRAQDIWNFVVRHIFRAFSFGFWKAYQKFNACCMQVFSSIT